MEKINLIIFARRPEISVGKTRLKKRIGRIQVEIIDDNSYEDSNNNFLLYENYKPLLENYSFQTKVNGENAYQYDAVFVLKEEKNQINHRFYV